MMTRFRQRRRPIPSLLVVLASFVVSQASVCEEKLDTFFETTEPAVDVVTDQEAPTFGDPLPGPNVTLFCDDNIMWTLADPALSDGRTGSGVDPASVTATTADGTSLPVTSDGGMYAASTSGLADGPVAITIDWGDLSGNTGSYQFSFNVDCTSPVIVLTLTPPSSTASMDPMKTFELGGTTTEPNPNSASAAVNDPGADGTCGTTDDIPYTSDLVDPPATDLPPSGPFTYSYVAYNLAGNTPRQVTYCTNFSAWDQTLDKFGNERFNTGFMTYRIDMEWSPVPPTTGDIEGVVTVDGEVPAGPVQVTLSTTGPSPNVLQMRATEADGTYRFPNLQLGPNLEPTEYAVTVTPPEGTTCSPETQTVTVVAGETVRADFDCQTPQVPGTYRGPLSYSSGDQSHTCCAWSLGLRSILMATNTPVSIRGLDFVPSALPQIGGDLADDGTITISGTATIAGIPNVSIVVTGTVDGTTLDIFLTVGGQGELPGGQPITYRFTGTKQ